MYEDDLGCGSTQSRTMHGPGISSLKLIFGADAVKDQSVAKLARGAGVRSQEQTAIPTQKALSVHPPGYGIP